HEAVRWMRLPPHTPRPNMRAAPTFPRERRPPTRKPEGADMDAGQNSIEAGRYTAIGAPSRVAGRYVLLVAARIAAQSSSFVPHDRMIAAASTDPSPRTTRFRSTFPCFPR